MAINFGPMPNFNVQTPDILGGQAKAATLAQMLNANALQKQLAPLQVQEQQQRVQQQTTANQMQQMELASQQAMVRAWSDPDFTKKITTGDAADSSGLGFDPDTMTKELTSRGVMPKDATALTNQFVDRSQKMAEIAKSRAQAGEAEATIRTKGFDALHDRVASVLEAAPAKQAAVAAQFAQDLVGNPKLFAGVPQDDLAHVHDALVSGDMAKLRVVGGALDVDRKIAEFHKSNAEAASAEATAGQRVRAAARPTTDQLTNAVNTVSTYNAIPRNMRVSLTNEMIAAPDWETLQKVQTRADAANESFQRSADARQQALAMKDVATQNLVAGKLVTEDEKLGTTLDSSKGIRDLLTQNLEGNQTALAAAQVRFAGHEIKQGGINRITQTEINSQTKSVGSFARQLQSWADKGFQGKAPVAGVDEMRAILDMEDNAAIASHQRNIDAVTNRFLGKNTSGAAPQNAATNARGATVKMRAPNGQVKDIPTDQIDHYKAMGATVVR